MAAVSGVLEEEKSNGSGTKDRNPYNKNSAAVPPQNAQNSRDTMPQSRAAQPLFRRYGSGKAGHGAVKNSNTAGINGNRKAGQYVND